MILYHGSYIEVAAPLVNVGRRNLDFGKGFYLTSLKEQAKKWAQLVSSRKGEEFGGVVSERKQSIVDQYLVFIKSEKV